MLYSIITRVICLNTLYQSNLRVLKHLTEASNLQKIILNVVKVYSAKKMDYSDI